MHGGAAFRSEGVEDRPREEETPGLALEAPRLTPLREDPAHESAVRMHHFGELQDGHGNGHGHGLKTPVDGQKIVEKHALHLLLVLVKEEEIGGLENAFCENVHKDVFFCPDPPRGLP